MPALPTTFGLIVRAARLGFTKTPVGWCRVSDSPKPLHSIWEFVPSTTRSEDFPIGVVKERRQVFESSTWEDWCERSSYLRGMKPVGKYLKVELDDCGDEADCGEEAK